MADPVIKVKRSAVAGKIPTPDQVPLGEIALNTYDGYLYASKNVGIGTTIIAINPFRVGAGTDSYNAYFTAGNIGIGTTLPTAKLDVYGTLNVSGVSTFQSNVYISNSSNSGRGWLRVGDLNQGYPTVTLGGTYDNTNPNPGWVDAWYLRARQTLYVENSLQLGNDTGTTGSIIYNNSSNKPAWNSSVYISPTTSNVGIGSTLPTSKLSVVGDGNFTGVVTASAFYGDGSNLTGISVGGSQWVSTDVGIHTLSSVGIGTTNPIAVVASDNTAVLAAGIVTAYKLYGDGSSLTGISAVARVTVSQTAPSSPTAGDLWYHTTLARLFVYFNDGNSDQWVDASPFNLQGSGSGTSVSVGATAPIGPSSGDLWYNSDYGRLFVYYRDGDSDQWVDAAPFNYPTRDTPTKTENAFTATQGQTTFAVTYEVGYIEVYVDGVRLNEDQYTATSGTSVILDSALNAGQSVAIVEIATGQGATGARGPAGETTLAGIAITAGSTTHYPIFVAGIGSTVPYISTTSNYFSVIPETGTLSVNQLNVTGVATASKFVGDGSQLTGVSGFATALSADTTSPLSKIFKTPKVLGVGAGVSVTVESDDASGDIAFMRESIIHVAVGGTFHIGAGTTLLMNVLNIF